MKTIILKTLVLATLAAGQAYAAPISLDNTASITATYNGKAEDVVGLDHDFQVEAGSNTTTLDPTNAGVEFLTADALFGFDFSTTGLLTVYNNLPAASNADYRLTFDFGSGLAAPITSFTLVDGSGLVSGMPGLTILGDHGIGLDLSGLVWTDGFGQFSARLGTADVPEPATAALVLAGAAGLATARRKRTSRA
ncbi:PEP-CTERM sorting domain-containing protein [Massilia sp. TW-1]|uniref:PEP-CTERM sorting domain-containing protein n=1 Tax=Telluria antibiotica TaxID=2717319 RepID=A0ABX0PJU3_9BURK|nr:PEP-CTERM sorting domain-containing protein [Telluria antibiotica]NIA57728.1 PEP-CTERM sorting domain-containing protein [Telluria antibiotica]